MKKSAFLLAFCSFLLWGCSSTGAASGPESSGNSSAVPVTEPPTEAPTEPAAEAPTAEVTSPAEPEYPSLISSADELGFADVTGYGENYCFSYGGEEFTALYWTDNWRILDSYKIRNSQDILLICSVLAELHPIHSADYSGWRTPEDMAYEWEQHNFAYDMSPEGSSYKVSSRDVDIDPKDQGRSAYDMLIDRLVPGSVPGR